MHIYFDFFGTLCDTSSTSLNATKAILERNGFDDVDPNHFKLVWDSANDLLCHGPFQPERSLFREGFLLACKSLELTPNSHSVDELIDATERRTLYPDAVGTIARLSRSHSIHVASNTDNHAIDAIIGPLRENLASVSTSENIGAYKPVDDFFEGMLANGKSDPVESLYVGDSLVNDVIAPTRHGIRSYLIDRSEAYPKMANSFASLTSFEAALSDNH